jgi:hypothetical protein
MCRSAQRCSIVADRTPDRLTSRANNQNEFTQTTYLGGEKAGGLAEVDGIDPSEAFALDIRRRMLAR